MCDSYGWIGKSKIIISNHNQTRTSEYMKHAAQKCGAKLCKYQELKIRTKNLVEKADTYYYILSRGKMQNTWTVSPFIHNLPKRVILILTHDLGEDICELWIVKEPKKLDMNRRGPENNEYYELTVDMLNNQDCEYHKKLFFTENEKEKKDTVIGVLEEVMGTKDE